MALTKVHPVYRFWFLWLDPMILVITVYALVFRPEAMWDALIPASPLSTYEPNNALLFHHLAALYAFMAIILGGLLRASKDIQVWRAVVAAVLVVDIAMLAVAYASLKKQYQLRPDAMRSSDWSNVLFTGLVTAIRIFFLAGIGVQNDKSKNKRELA